MLYTRVIHVLNVIHTYEIFIHVFNVMYTHTMLYRLIKYLLDALLALELELDRVLVRPNFLQVQLHLPNVPTRNQFLPEVAGTASTFTESGRFGITSRRCLVLNCTCVLTLRSHLLQVHLHLPKVADSASTFAVWRCEQIGGGRSW